MEFRHFGKCSMLSPVPVAMVTSVDSAGKPNIFTAAWCGTVCTKPPMITLGIKPERYSHGLIKQSGECVLNMTSASLVRAADYCGVKSGRDTDKFADMRLTPIKTCVSAPAIAESPLNIPCRVKEIIPLGSHDMFILEVMDVALSESLFSGEAPDLGKANLVSFAHGEYYLTGEKLGFFGFSVASKEVLRRRMPKRGGGK
ncbi:MAG: flavin reductase family protein [Eubacteriales bacterium]|nr:flavin reductase family protein [Eubacteriales bacterium]MDD3881637.1 flavin reductase family protein [Eubacteriales bacterium]MDD4512304.1 flavin reductase family protein [Eubacteriales bacterium]